MLHIFCNGPHLRGGSGIANDEKICCCIVDIPKVDADDVFSLFLLDTVNDNLYIGLGGLFLARLFFLYLERFDSC